MADRPTIPDDLQREIAKVVWGVAPYLKAIEWPDVEIIAAAVTDVLRRNGLGRGRCAYPDGDRDCDPSLCPPECFEASR